MISLGGVVLPDVVIDNEFGEHKVRSVVEFSLGGRPIIWEDVAYGPALDLVGGEDYAWIDRQTLKELQGLSAVPQSSYTLIYESDTFLVRFRNEDAPVIEAQPIVARPNQDDSDWYQNLRIKLMKL